MKNFVDLKRVKCCIPFCEEKAHMINVPMIQLEMGERTFEFGRTVSMCLAHISYYESGDICFEYDQKADNLRVYWTEEVDMGIQEKKENIKKND